MVVSRKRQRRRLRVVVGRGQAAKHPSGAAQQPPIGAGARTKLGRQLLPGRRRLVGQQRLLPRVQPFGRFVVWLELFSTSWYPRATLGRRPSIRRARLIEG
jgi:hypothetical protein